jgi:hypothetical protein
LTAPTVQALLTRMWEPQAAAKTGTTMDREGIHQLVLLVAGGAALLPLADGDFLAGVPDDTLKSCVPELTALAARTEDESSRKGSHLVLFAVVRKLGLKEERQRVAAALKELDGSFDERAFDGQMRDLLGQIRKVLRQLTAGR